MVGNALHLTMSWLARVFNRAMLFVMIVLYFQVYYLLYGLCENNYAWDGSEFIVDQWPSPKAIVCRPISTLYSADQRVWFMGNSARWCDFLFFFIWPQIFPYLITRTQQYGKFSTPWRCGPAMPLNWSCCCPCPTSCHGTEKSCFTVR